MTLVDDCREIEENLKALELVRSSGKGVEFENYRSLVAKGHVFLPYLTTEGIAFAPSRFLGYKGNTVRKHAQREHKDGRETTPRIRQVLAKKFGFTTWNSADSEAEAYYFKFCSSLGVEPNKVERTYWITPEIGDWLSDHPSESYDAKTEARRDEELEQAVRNDGSLPETTRASIIRARVGQGLFRRLVLRKYGSCLITALTEHKLLIASHIKPWRDCCHNPAECLSPDNALLLSPT
ncbi:HNH endonuclease signature motif containing protein [Cereibacter sphaeroides]|uniref:HNH endonuclease signature motif containing protein n=1 Tax=Cereibacter sphaeroides TaxID=1063 RepID=UPI00140FBD87|nr:HNH endonuclease signature motif containing protein [Cereibacter sphaeroides]